MEQTKISRDFQTAILAFQRIQKQSVERQRHSVDRAKAVITDQEDGGSSSSGTPALFVFLLREPFDPTDMSASERRLREDHN